MNPLRHVLPNFLAEPQQPTAEEIAAQEKQDRIDFHRAKVRNGPVSWKIPTNGQLRRQHLREIERNQKKTLRKLRKANWEARMGAAFRGLGQ